MVWQIPSPINQMREFGRTIAAEAQVSTGNLNRHPPARSAYADSRDARDAHSTTHALDARLPATQPDSTVQLLLDVYHKTSQDPAARKIMIRNIADEVSDSVIESFLLEMGEFHYWKRTKNEAGKPVSFGTTEFVSVEGLLKAIRIIPRFVLFDKKLEVSPPSEKCKGLISDFVQYRKAEIAARRPDLSDEAIDDLLTQELTEGDDTIVKKLKLIIEKFEQHRGRIIKASVTEKNSIVAATEEKLGLFKQRFGLMNEKELNEEYSRAVEAWLKKEREWEEYLERELAEEKNAHTRKIALIDAELKVKDEDLDPKNEKQEAAFRRARERRAQILREDQETERPKIDITMQDLGKGRREAESGRRKDRPEGAEETHEGGRKRIKGEVLTLQPTQRPETSLANRDTPVIDQAKPTSGEAPVQINFSLSIDQGNHQPLQFTQPLTDIQRRAELAERDARQDLPIIFEGKGAGAAETIHKLSRKVEESKEKFENLEKLLMR